MLIESLDKKICFSELFEIGFNSQIVSLLPEQRRKLMNLQKN